MDKSLMEGEISKIQAIYSQGEDIGFISSSGFDHRPDDVILINGEDIYDALL